MTQKASGGNFFEDFSVGQAFQHGAGRTITEGDCALYLGLTGDRFPLYSDGRFAQLLGYRRELANDLLVFHVVFGKTVPDISQNAVANLGYAGVRFLGAVYPGDTLSARSEVVGVKENSNGKTGNVYVRTEGLNQKGETALEFYRWVMVRKRDASSPAPETVIPELPEAVDDFYVDPLLTRKLIPETPALGPYRFEDYEVGERIAHGAGMTIEEAEHATATRLYQNTARVHFNLHEIQADGGSARLMYGGHVISVARALSYNGLENNLRILAWNGGTHANPTYAGDTIYAQTEVVAKYEIDGHGTVGGLRMRLYGIKNLNPARESIEMKSFDASKGRETYHPNVVLELDYTVLCPRRGL